MDKRSQLNCLKECGRLLGLGCSVLFFPEGTRTRDGKMAAFKKVGHCLWSVLCIVPTFLPCGWVCFGSQMVADFL